MRFSFQTSMLMSMDAIFSVSFDKPSAFSSLMISAVTSSLTQKGWCFSDRPGLTPRPFVKAWMR